jgi:hypothetical protein
MPKHVATFIRAKGRISKQVTEKHGFKLMRGHYQKVTVFVHKRVKQATEYGNIELYV